MKKLLVYGLCLSMCVVLAACGATPLTDGQKELQQAQYDAQQKCYERLSGQDLILKELILRVPQDQVALVLVLQTMQENNKALMSMATGRGYNPCDMGKNAFDVQIAEVIEKNGSLKSGISSVTGLGKWIVGGLTINSALDKIGEKTVNSITGDGNEINKQSKNNTSTTGSITADQSGNKSEIVPEEEEEGEEEALPEEGTTEDTETPAEETPAI